MAKPALQEQFAKAIGVTKQDVSKMLGKGILTRGATQEEWLLEYTKNLRYQAAQHRSLDGIDRVREAALLDRRKREQLDIELDKQRGQLWPKEAIWAAWEARHGIIRTALLGLPSLMRSMDPTMTAKQVAVAEDAIRQKLTELANEQFPATVDAIAAKYFSDLHAAAETDGERMGGHPPGTEPGVKRRAG